MVNMVINFLYTFYKWLIDQQLIEIANTNIKSVSTNYIY